MAFVLSWSRATARRRWVSLLGIALLLAIIGGLSLFALAGARRTQSSYPRFLRAKNPSTMAVDVGGLQPDGYAALDAISKFPEVTRARAYTSFYSAPWVDDAPVLDQSFEVIASMDGRYFDQDVFTPTDGRLPDPTRSDEVAVNAQAAKLYGYHVGQQVDFATISEDDVANLPPPDEANPDPSAGLQPRLLTHATIVGVGSFVEEVIQDDTDRSPLLLFTPAFTQEAKGLETYAWVGLQLRNGDADVEAVKQRVTDLLEGPQIFRVTSLDVFHAEQAIRPISLALATFGLIAGAAGFVLVGQAVSRHIRTEREVLAIARSIGGAPTQLAASAAVGPLVAVVVGGVLAGLVAFLASPAMPIGPVRQFEVSSGFDLDWTVLGFGVLALVVLLSAVAIVAAVREEPHRVQRRARLRRPSHGAAALGAMSMPLPVTTGVHLAFEPGEGTTSVPVRSVMAGTVIAVAALVAAVTFGASLANLVRQPRLYGWDWDVAMVDSAGYGNTHPEATERLLGGDPDVASWGGAFYGADEIDGVNLPVLGMDVDSQLTPPIRTGRMIAAPDEIVLGTASLAALHKEVGDTVSSPSGDLTIVGTATLPSIGQVHGDHTSLGIGAIVVTDSVPGYDRNFANDYPDVDPAQAASVYGPNVLFIRYRDGVDKAAVGERLQGYANEIGDFDGAFVTPVQRSAEIVNADDISGSSTLLGIAVAIAALASLTVALTAAVRRRRRDLALLKALGFTRRQLSATVASQATITIAVGLLIGAPIGIIVGRVLWSRFADQLDVLAEPVVPLLAIGVVALGALVAANILSALPARLARRVPSALTLRSE